MLLSRSSYFTVVASFVIVIVFVAVNFSFSLSVAVTTTVPAFTAVRRPFASIVATSSLSTDQSTPAPAAPSGVYTASSCNVFDAFIFKESAPVICNPVASTAASNSNASREILPCFTTNFTL